MNTSNWYIKSGFFLLKAAIVAGSVFFIYFKVISRPDFDEMVKQLSLETNFKEHFSLLFLLVILMMFNWFIETAKWKLLLKRIQPSGWLLSLRSVLSGVTISIFTPNRMGEFAGRVMHLPEGSRIKAAIASVIGSMNQLLVTLVAGGVGLLVSMQEFDQEQNYMTVLKYLAVVLGMIGVTLIYFRMSILSRLGERIKNFRQINLYTKVFALYPIAELFTLTLLSLARYFIFTFQFFLVLQLFSIHIEYTQALRLISLIYLVLAVVPSISLSELTVRGSVALYFLSPLTGNSAGIVAASSLLWLLNLIVPALFGALAAFYFRLNK